MNWFTHEQEKLYIQTMKRDELRQLRKGMKESQNIEYLNSFFDYLGLFSTKADRNPHNFDGILWEYIPHGTFGESDHHGSAGVLITYNGKSFRLLWRVSGYDDGHHSNHFVPEITHHFDKLTWQSMTTLKTAVIEALVSIDYSPKKGGQ